MVTTSVLCIAVLLFLVLIFVVYCCNDRENMSTKMDHDTAATTIIIAPTVTPNPDIALATEIKTALKTLIPKRPWKISNVFIYNQDVVFVTVDVESSTTILYFTMLPIKKALLLEDYSGNVSSEELSRWTYVRY